MKKEKSLRYKALSLAVKMHQFPVAKKNLMDKPLNKSVTDTADHFLKYLKSDSEMCV